ncbi:glycosyl transferase family 1 [Enterococcus florum]|uniref:Glycosyl transferase family 1 n=1 Tax=Enterococcus florum TaxID=2480627 RepID=A0A4P5P7F7_9ENTE|nr:glycosyltransferase family 1 protein [Enterococcus florum]GCF93915.1 glycosyl transferase family 1 [Enterococcus florum]
MVKRILHFQGRMGLGGAESFMMNLYRKLDKEEFQFDFLIYDDYQDVTDYQDEVLKLGGRFFVVTNPKKNIFKYLHEVRMLLKKEHFDIVHNQVYFGGGINLWLSKRNGIGKRIAHSHATEDGKGQGFLVSILRFFLAKLLLNNGTDFLAVSEEAGISLFGNHPFQIVHNGIDLSLYDHPKKTRELKRDELGIEKETFVIGNIGRLEKQKNQLYLINVFYEIKKIKKRSKLVIVGSGSLENDLKEQVRVLGLDSDVLFLGERRDIPELMSVFDVFVLSSIYEGLPMVGLEAQAAKKKLVMSDRISRDTAVTPNCVYINLAAPISEWVKGILEEPYDNDYTPLLEKYDVSYTLNQMEKIYRKKV